jgi:integrase
MPMASIHTQPGRPFWYCAYTDHQGKRRFVSTKTEDRAEAEKFARKIADTVDKARTNRLTPDNARAVIEGVVEDILASIGGTLEKKTTRQFLEGVWLKGKTGSTGERYAGMTKQFLKFLGPKADRAISIVSSADFEGFKNELAEKLAPSSVRLTIKVLRSAFKRAVQLQLIDKNPGAFVEVADDGERVEKLDFSKEQIDDLFQNANDDWRTMILLGKYTGQRLQDLANLRLTNVDLLKELIRITRGSRKTGRVVEIPMASKLKAHLLTLPMGDDANAFLLPNLADKRSGWLSNQFNGIMASAGMTDERTHKTTGKGRSSRRTVNPYGFHSFRHSATSFLKNAGIPEAVARDIIGHDSASISRQYTHIDLETKRKAVKKMARHLEGKR